MQHVMISAVDSYHAFWPVPAPFHTKVVEPLFRTCYASTI
jgi:hypothetical protein